MGEEKKKQGAAIKNWCFTEQAGNQFDLLVAEARRVQDDGPRFLDDAIRFICFSIERAPTTGRLHLQGYLQLHKRLRLQQVKAFLPTAHLEVARGTAAENVKYCSKDKNPAARPGTLGWYYQWGELSQQGKASKLTELAEEISTGQIKTAAEAFRFDGATFIRHHRGITAALDAASTAPERGRPEIYHLHGPSGAGKTSRVKFELAERKWAAYWVTDTNPIWFDGYNGEDVIVFDEFTGVCPLRFINKLCDSQPMRLPIKGGHVHCRATKFFFTSNERLEDAYVGSTDRSGWQSWVRRIADYGNRLLPLEGADRAAFYARLAPVADADDERASQATTEILSTDYGGEGAIQDSQSSVHADHQEQDDNRLAYRRSDLRNSPRAGDSEEEEASVGDQIGWQPRARGWLRPAGAVLPGRLSAPDPVDPDEP